MQRSFLPFILIGLFVCGCGHSTATAIVNGTVRFDGQPLADASVVFEPTDGSRPSAGTTDASGKYTLRFNPTTEGAIAGEHIVSIRTAPAEPDPENPAVERLPSKYHSATELKATLKSGRQTIDFDLTP